jgi:ABC-2 type transport system ATP-binding protein
MTDLAIDVDQLRKAFGGAVAVDRLSFHVRRGEAFALLGPNGAGKTTTLRLLLDVLRPDAGAVRLFGRPPADVRERVGYLPQERGLYPELRVEECLTYLGELKGLARAEARRRAVELLGRVGLADSAGRRVGELSRGTAQKVQVVGAFLHRPELVVLDEPFQALDPISVAAARELVRDFRAGGGTVVLSAHDLAQVEALCDRLLLLDRGRAVLLGSLAEVKAQFAPSSGLTVWPPVDIAGWPGVLGSEVHGRSQTVRLAPELAPADFLRMALDRGWRPERLERVEPPLEQVFLAALQGRAAP